MLRFVSYHRVSTAREVPAVLDSRLRSTRSTRLPPTVLASFTEIESGTIADRLEFLKALHLAKVTDARLAVARLDRLSRNAAFLLALRDSGVRFVAVDLPGANDLTVSIMALVAQQEREAVPRRTKEALAAAKVRGAKLGNQTAPQLSGEQARAPSPSERRSVRTLTSMQGRSLP